MLLNSELVLPITFIENALRARFPNVEISIEETAGRLSLGYTFQDVPYNASLGTTDKLTSSYTLSDYMEKDVASLFLDKNTVSRLTHLSKEGSAKTKKAVVYLHTDLETSMLNSIFIDAEDKLAYAAKEGTIFEIAVKPMTKEKELGGFHRYLKNEGYYVQTLDNFNFQNKTGFKVIYEKAISDNDNVANIKDLDDLLVSYLSDLANALGKELKPYSYGNDLVFKLAGRSVAFDLDFLKMHAPRASMYFSHELMDVSAFKNFYRDAVPRFNIASRDAVHTALDDAKDSLESHVKINKFFESVAKLTDNAKDIDEVNAKLEELTRLL